MSDELDRIHETLQLGFKGVHDRLDALNGRTRANEQDIAVLKDRGARDPAARWIGGLAMAGGVLWEVLKKATGGAQ